MRRKNKTPEQRPQPEIPPDAHVFRHDAETNTWQNDKLNQIELQRVSHKMELAELIVAGKTLEALACLFRPDEISFGIEVVYADDPTRIAAEKERAVQMAGIAHDAVLAALQPKEKNRSK